MAAEEMIVELVNRLTLLDNQIETLDELKTAVTAMNPVEMRHIIPNISITNVFDCLNSPDKPRQQLCAEILNRMLSTLSSTSVLENFSSQLSSWFRMKDVELKALCLPQFSRISQEAPAVLCQYQDVVLGLVEEVSSDSLQIGPAVAAILTHMGRDPNGLQILFSDPVVEKIKVAMQKNDTTRFRVYQIATELSALSPSALDASVQSGLLQQLVNETHTDDILIQLNAIELVSDLARSPHGLAFLDQQGVVNKLERMISELDNNPMCGLLLPGLIKFFGGLAKHHPKEVLSKFQNFVRVILTSISEGEPTVRGVAVDTIGFIGRSPEGKLALEKIGNPLTECIQGIGSQLKTGTSDMKARSLHALVNLTYIQVANQTNELLNLSEKWFGRSTSDPFNTVWSIAQQPFPELRILALQLLQSLALTPWGQKFMNNTPGFKEYLLDRSTENSKEGKEEKFELIRFLAHSPTVVDICGQPFQVKLMEYYNQGPFFVLAQSEVAMEGE